MWAVLVTPVSTMPAGAVVYEQVGHTQFSTQSSAARMPPSTLCLISDTTSRAPALRQSVRPAPGWAGVVSHDVAR
jgi:hypothetical protein